LTIGSFCRRLHPVPTESPIETRPVALRSVAAAIAGARRAAGLTREQLAERCGEHPVSIALLERGREPRLATVLKVAAALDVSVEDLCAGVAWDVERQRFV
jgi:transcriptional regulator with XRE-family HTH domain